jgi:hypothetical protein
LYPEFDGTYWKWVKMAMGGVDIYQTVESRFYHVGAQLSKNAK